MNLTETTVVRGPALSGEIRRAQEQGRDGEQGGEDLRALRLELIKP